MFPFSRKKCQILQCQILLFSQHRMVQWCILVERGRETEKNAIFPGSVGHICKEKEDVQVRKLKNVHAQFCFSAIFQRL